MGKGPGKEMMDCPILYLCAKKHFCKKRLEIFRIDEVVTASGWKSNFDMLFNDPATKELIR